MSKPISIVIVDDHEIIRRGVRDWLETHDEFSVVGMAESGKTAVTLVEEHIPDVVLMDLVMPGMDGVEATRLIKKVSPRTQVVVLTSYHDDEHIFPALKAGALSYILKDVKMEELGEVVRQASRSEASLSSRVAARVIQELDTTRQDKGGSASELTPREMELLKMIAHGSSNSAIAGELFISEHTVKGHVSNILNKLQLADRTQAAVFAWQRGLVQPD
ncbi:MAG: response regulator transcription factor [Actinomycetia bacterium]|nr:response regulator transcription factor [Actinomycetes bacterium]